MVGSSEGERAGVGFGDGVRAMEGSGGVEQAMEGSGGVEQAMEGSGGGKHSLLHSLDYPCTTRFRLRRLLSYLRGHSYANVYQAAKGKMRVVFHVRDLVKQVKAGQWREAALYVHSFAPFNQSGYETGILALFLQVLMALNDFADGYVMVPRFLCNWLVSIYKKPMLAKYPCLASLVADVLFLRSAHASTFLDWELVRDKAATKEETMVNNSPELRGRMQYPRGRNNLYHIMPIGSRRHVKNTGRKQSTDLVQFYVQAKKRLPSSSTRASHSSSEEALKAGRHLELEQGHTPECSFEQGFPFVQALLANGSVVNGLSRQELQPEHSSEKVIPQGTAVWISSEFHSGKLIQILGPRHHVSLPPFLPDISNCCKGRFTTANVAIAFTFVPNSLLFFDPFRCVECWRLIEAGDWDGTNALLEAFLASAEQLQEPTNYGIRHPLLTLHARTEHVLSALGTDRDGAIDFFKAHIRPLLSAAGPYVPNNEHWKTLIHKIQNDVEAGNGRVCELPQKRAIFSRICDYIRLYFPEYIDHDMRTNGRYKELWDFAMVEKEGGVFRRTDKGRLWFRCLACGWSNDSSMGIDGLGLHLHGRLRGDKSCKMVTPKLLERLPQLQRKPRMRKRRTDSSSRNQLPGPSHQGASEGCPLGFIYAMIIVRAEHKMSKILDDTLKLLDVPTSGFKGVRDCLQELSRLCDNAIQSETGRLISAPAVKHELWEMRDKVKTSRESRFNWATKNALDRIHSLNLEINSLEESCTAACLPSVADPTLQHMVSNVVRSLAHEVNGGLGAENDLPRHTDGFTEAAGTAGDSSESNGDLEDENITEDDGTDDLDDIGAGAGAEAATTDGENVGLGTMDTGIATEEGLPGGTDDVGLGTMDTGIVAEDGLPGGTDNGCLGAVDTGIVTENDLPGAADNGNAEVAVAAADGAAKSAEADWSVVIDSEGEEWLNCLFSEGSEYLTANLDQARVSEFFDDLIHDGLGVPASTCAPQADDLNDVSADDYGTGTRPQLNNAPQVDVNESRPDTADKQLDD